MSTSLDLRVVFLDHLIYNITVNGSENPGSVTVLGPPLKTPVYVVHKGRCLSPFMSLAVQGVVTGDLLVLAAVPGFRAAQVIDSPKPTDRRDTAFSEMLRLTDVAFIPFESSLCGRSMYQHMYSETQIQAESRCRAPMCHDTVLAEKPGEIPARRLPVCWGTPRSTPKARPGSPSLRENPKPTKRKIIHS
jgi:hypothetical protein